MTKSVWVAFGWFLHECQVVINSDINCELRIHKDVNTAFVTYTWFLVLCFCLLGPLMIRCVTVHRTLTTDPRNWLHHCVDHISPESIGITDKPVWNNATMIVVDYKGQCQKMGMLQEEVWIWDLLEGVCFSRKKERKKRCDGIFLLYDFLWMMITCCLGTLTVARVCVRDRHEGEIIGIIEPRFVLCDVREHMCKCKCTILADSFRRLLVLNQCEEIVTTQKLLGIGAISVTCVHELLFAFVF